MTLEQRLLALADDAFPPTPDLAAWAANIGSQPTNAAQGWRRQWTRSRWLPLALAALLVPATAAAVIALQPEHIRIEYVQTLPDLPANTPRLGPEVNSIDEASRRAGFRVQALPDREPESIHVLGNLVTLAYPDVVITETPARDQPEFLVKKVGPGTTVQRVAQGYFLSGAPHEVAYLAPDGEFVLLAPRLAGNTLAIERDGLVIRIEGKDLSKPRSLRLSQALAKQGSTSPRPPAP